MLTRIMVNLGCEQPSVRTALATQQFGCAQPCWLRTMWKITRQPVKLNRIPKFVGAPPRDPQGRWAGSRRAAIVGSGLSPRPTPRCEHQGETGVVPEASDYSCSDPTRWPGNGNVVAGQRLQLAPLPCGQPGLRVSRDLRSPRPPDTRRLCTPHAHGRGSVA